MPWTEEADPTTIWNEIADPNIYGNCRFVDTVDVAWKDTTDINWISSYFIELYTEVLDPTTSSSEESDPSST
jgi:hypothetical protein